MSVAGGHWYTSSGFWGPTAGVVTTVIIGIVTVWVTWRVAHPKRRLVYAVVPDDLQAAMLGNSRPRVVTVGLKNVGRHDISRNDFDGMPLRFDLDARIVEWIDMGTIPEDQVQPEIVTEESALLISPVKISAQELLYVKLVVDSAKPSLGKPVQSLTNVEILPIDAGDARIIKTTLVMWAILIITGVIAAYQPRVNGSLSGSIVFGSFLLGLCVAIIRFYPLRSFRRWVLKLEQKVPKSWLDAIFGGGRDS